VKKVTAADLVYSSTELVHLGLKDSMLIKERPSISIIEYTQSMLTQAVQSNRVKQGIIEEEKHQELEVDEVDESESELESESESDMDVKSDGSEAIDEVEDAGLSIEALMTLAVNAFDHLTETSRAIDMPHQTHMPVLETFVSVWHDQAIKNNKQASRSSAKHQYNLQ
jgi:hypothetical protein